MNSLRTKLTLWYLLSLFILTLFFYLAVHIYQIPNSSEYFVALIILLAILGFIVIYKITESVIYLTGKMKQVTDKSLNEKVRDLGNDEIGELAKAFNELLARLDTAFRREQQFIGDIAHELKTPLATMRTSLEITLSKKRTDEEYRQTIKEAILDIDRLSGTVKNVLDLAWVESRENSRQPSDVDLSGLMAEVSDIAAKLAATKEINIISTIDEGIKISGFRERLARAILNVIDNAVKYTQPGGKIEISLENVNHQALIVIKDNGQGIAKEELPHIFDRFYRGAKTDKVFGSGLGMAIAKSIVQLHGGDIKVKSQPGRGTTFAIVIPIV